MCIVITLQIFSRETSFWSQVLFHCNADSHYLCASTLLQSQQCRCFVVMPVSHLPMPPGWCLWASASLTGETLQSTSSQNAAQKTVSEYCSSMDFRLVHAT